MLLVLTLFYNGCQIEILLTTSSKPYVGLSGNLMGDIWVTRRFIFEKKICSDIPDGHLVIHLEILSKDVSPHETIC